MKNPLLTLSLLSLLPMAAQSAHAYSHASFAIGDLKNSLSTGTNLHEAERANFRLTELDVSAELDLTALTSIEQQAWNQGLNLPAMDYRTSITAFDPSSLTLEEEVKLEPIAEEVSSSESGEVAAMPHLPVPEELHIPTEPIAVSIPDNSRVQPTFAMVELGQLPDLKTSTTHLPSPNTNVAAPSFIWPAQGEITSNYGMRWGRMHKGIDIAGPIGTPIFATAPGVVTYSGWNSGGYGNLVEITHSGGMKTLYAHNSQVLVQVGQQVEQGQQIAEMGSTGYSTGPHLHFEVIVPGHGTVNPLAVLEDDQRIAQR